MLIVVTRTMPILLNIEYQKIIQVQPLAACTLSIQNPVRFCPFSVICHQTSSMSFQGTIVLLVDEISPDKIKATVSRPTSIAVNMRTVYAYSLVPSLSRRHIHLQGESPLGEPINGLSIFPAGKYICMVVRS